MKMNSLHLHNFRSHVDREFQFDPRLTAIIGPNGSGKTNILEAIYTLCMGKSFRDGDDELITYQEDWYRIEGLIDEVARELRYQPSNKGKQLMIEGASKGRFTYRQQLPVVLFEPDDLLMIHASPSARRKYIDELLQKLYPHMRTLFHRYERVVTQRNNLLKNHRSLAQLKDDIFVWDVSLAELGAQIVTERQALIERINQTISDIYSQVAGSSQKVLVEYISETTPTHDATQLAAALSKHLAQDVRRGFTTSGPHRDDIEFYLNAQPAKHTASRGEVRSLVLALKQQEVHLLSEERDSIPLFLLDDVFSELDATRQKAILKSVDVQTILTSTELKASDARVYQTIKLG